VFDFLLGIVCFINLCLFDIGPFSVFGDRSFDGNSIVKRRLNIRLVSWQIAVSPLIDDLVKTCFALRNLHHKFLGYFIRHREYVQFFVLSLHGREWLILKGTNALLV